MNAVGHIISHKHKGEGMEEEGRSRKKFQEGNLVQPRIHSDEER